jgi:hypothetical protein
LWSPEGKNYFASESPLKVFGMARGGPKSFTSNSLITLPEDPLWGVYDVLFPIKLGGKELCFLFSLIYLIPKKHNHPKKQLLQQ